MYTYTLTKKAKADLIEIARYTQNQWGKEQRNFYLKQIDDAFTLLTENPQAGLACTYIKKSYRKFSIASHVLFYRESSKHHLEIVRILHKSMDVDATTM